MRVALYVLTRISILVCLGSAALVILLPLWLPNARAAADGFQQSGSVVALFTTTMLLAATVAILAITAGGLRRYDQ